MPSSVHCHLAILPGGILVSKGLEYHYSAGLSPARRAPSIPEKASLCLAKVKNGMQDIKGFTRD
jgi:hypothetical protein